MRQLPSDTVFKTKRLRNRGEERRCGQRAFAGPDRRRSTYDRRKLREAVDMKPPMSSAGQQVRHAPGYVAGLAADLGAYRRASGLEASQRYGSAKEGRTARLLRGLTVDAQID